MFNVPLVIEITGLSHYSGQRAELTYRRREVLVGARRQKTSRTVEEAQAQETLGSVGVLPQDGSGEHQGDYRMWLHPGEDVYLLKFELPGVS